MGTMIGNDGLRDTKPSNDVIEYELSSCLTVSGKCRHCFGPFGEVVHGYDNIGMPPSRVRVTRHKIDAPLRKGTNGNDRMKRNEWHTNLALINLAIMAFTNRDNAVFEDRRLEITKTKNILCSGITRHVTATSATVKIIEDFLNFLEGQTSTENGIHSDTIEGIPDYTIRLRLMTDASAGILLQLRSESRILEINDDITVPRIKGANQEKRIVWYIFLTTRRRRV